MKKIQTYKSFNESLKDKIKGKSNQDILDSIKDMIPEHKFTSACKHHMTWLVEKLIKEGHDPSFGDNMCLINCGILKYDDIVNILLKNDKVIKQLYKTQLDKALGEYDQENGYYDDDDNWIDYDEDQLEVNWSYGDEYEDEDEYDDYEEDEEDEEEYVPRTTGTISTEKVEPNLKEKIKDKIKNVFGSSKNESLRDKMKGKSEDEVVDALPDLIYDIVQQSYIEIHTELYNDEELSDIIQDNFMDDILYGLEEGESRKSIITFVVDLLEEYIRKNKK